MTKWTMIRSLDGLEKYAREKSYSGYIDKSDHPSSFPVLVATETETHFTRFREPATAWIFVTVRDAQVLIDADVEQERTKKGPV